MKRFTLLTKVMVAVGILFLVAGTYFYSTSKPDAYGNPSDRGLLFAFVTIVGFASSVSGVGLEQDQRGEFRKIFGHNHRPDEHELVHDPQGTVSQTIEIRRLETWTLFEEEQKLQREKKEGREGAADALTALKARKLAAKDGFWQARNVAGSRWLGYGYRVPTYITESAL